MQYRYIDEECPELVKYFKDSKDAHVGIASCKKSEVICPCCLRPHFMRRYDIYNKRSTCCVGCRDGFSYPERLMYNLLQSLGVSFIYQFTDTWTQKYRYDFYFEHKKRKYFIEMDGGIGHGYANESNPWFSADNILHDKEKDLLAKEHHITLIRIDCNYENTNRLTYIKQNILSSILYNLFDFSNVNWEEIHNKSINSLFLQVIDLYKSGIKSLQEISDSTGIKNRTIKKYLKEAMVIGIIKKEKIFTKKPFSNIPQTVIYKIENISSKCNPIYCYEDALVFGSIKDAGEYYGCNPNLIRQGIMKCNEYYNNRHFTYYKNLPVGFNFMPLFFPDNSYKEHIYLCFDKNINLVDFYKGTKNFPKGINYSNVFRAIKSRNGLSYGYYWHILPKKIEYQLHYLTSHIDQLNYLKNNKEIFDVIRKEKSYDTL